MKSFFSIVVASVIIVGCSPNVPSTPASTTAPPGSPNQVQASEDGVQTIQSNGFNLQIRKGWSMIASMPQLVLGSPTDQLKQISGVPVSVTIIAQSSDDAQKTMELMLGHARKIGAVESETACTVAGVTGTKLVTKKVSKISDNSDETLTTLSLTVYVPFSVGLLSVTASGSGEKLPNAMPEIEWMMSTIKIQ